MSSPRSSPSLQESAPKRCGDTKFLGRLREASRGCIPSMAKRRRQGSPRQARARQVGKLTAPGFEAIARCCVGPALPHYAKEIAGGDHRDMCGGRLCPIMPNAAQGSLAARQRLNKIPSGGSPTTVASLRCGFAQRCRTTLPSTTGQGSIRGHPLQGWTFAFSAFSRALC